AGVAVVSEWSTRKTLPAVHFAASLAIVRPPPQPMSRIVSCGLIEMWWRPQSVTAEWLLFIRKSSRRPSHPEGLLDCVTGTFLGAMCAQTDASMLSRERRQLA